MARSFSFKIGKNNTKEVIRIERETLFKVLTAWGILAQGYATEYCPKDTGNLSQSIDYGIIEDAITMQVGTDVKYAPYVELGTGIYATGEGGSGAKKIPWHYKDDEGCWHTTSGMKAQPYLRPAIEKHLEEYEDILKDYLSEQI